MLLLAPRVGDRIRGPLTVAAAVGLLLRGALSDLDLELVDGTGDRLLDQLPIQRPIDDQRVAAVELDHHAGGARLVDLRV
jgi:hypothetical protein